MTQAGERAGPEVPVSPRAEDEVEELAAAWADTEAVRDGSVAAPAEAVVVQGAAVQDGTAVEQDESPAARVEPVVVEQACSLVVLVWSAAVLFVAARAGAARVEHRDDCLDGQASSAAVLVVAGRGEPPVAPA